MYHVYYCTVDSVGSRLSPAVYLLLCRLLYCCCRVLHVPLSPHALIPLSTQYDPRGSAAYKPLQSTVRRKPPCPQGSPLPSGLQSTVAFRWYRSFWLGPSSNLRRYNSLAMSCHLGNHICRNCLTDRPVPRNCLTYRRVAACRASRHAVVGSTCTCNLQ